MLVRLAFAIQAQIEPEILIVDEALAVGDARFQAKCFARLKQLKETERLFCLFPMRLNRL
jgi:lipopolysaccharide transport system ATP-binding protein